MSRLRVLHVITMLELGGAQRNTLDTVRLLDRGAFEPALACGPGGDLDPEAAALPDVPWYQLEHLRREVRPGDDIRALRELRRVIRTFRPAIVHTHSSKAGVLGRLAARLERVPVVVHSIHGYGFGPHQSLAVRRTFLVAERLVARGTTHFIAVSRRNLEKGVALGLFPPERASVIRSGIDLTTFRNPPGGQGIRRELGIPPDAVVVVQVSCLKPQKAPERFGRLAQTLAPLHPRAHFVLVGDGALRPELERYRTGDLEARLHLPGWRRDVPAFLAAAQVATLTSRFEGLPRAVVEALTAGVPVVAMRVDGVEEVVREGIDGFLVEEGDEEALAERVGRLLTDASLRERMAARAGEGLEGEFDRATMVHQQEELYRELACRHGLPTP